ncbi:MAG: MBOAT family O-acyltransferase [Rhodospirillales bacterium]
MIFNDFTFLFVFLPAVLIAFYLPGLQAARYAVLTVASLVFYGMAGVEHAVVLAADVLWVYWVVTRRGFRESRFMLAAAVVPPVLALVYYKYLGFLLRMFIGAEAAADSETFSFFAGIVLPAGISFFTFQAVAFAVDRHRGEIEVPPLDRFFTFITFFPQLVAGPILRLRDVAEPLSALTRFKPDEDFIARGIGYICLGLAVKVLLADTLGHNIADYREAPGALAAVSAWYTVFAYSFQIYFDFYGYSLIAIGLGSFFGFRFPKNFDRPYNARNIRDFWRRWHMTLSYWIRDYLYVPLGGNRAYARNILIVMAVCGLWHGAGWSFIVWGLYHGVLVVAYHYTRGAYDRLPTLLQISLTFVLVSIGWVLFLFDFQDAAMFAQSAFGAAETVTQAGPSAEMWAGLGTAAAAAFFVRIEPLAENTARGLRGLAAQAVLAFVFVAVLFFIDRSETFIYFRF